LKQIKGKYGAHAIAIGQGTGRCTEAYNVRLKNTLGTPNSSAGGRVLLPEAGT
jgi:hypothetical protein